MFLEPNTPSLRNPETSRGIYYLLWCKVRSCPKPKSLHQAAFAAVDEHLRERLSGAGDRPSDPVSGSGYRALL